jgi:hypothetical protein
MSRPRIVPAIAILLLAVMGLLAGGAARRESITIDEVAHIGAGVSYLQRLDMRMNEEHPPLAKVVAALPLVMRGIHADYAHVSWTFSAGIFHQYLGEWVFGHWLVMRWNDPYATVFWARVPMLLLTLALGAVVFVFGSRLGGPWGGLLCVCAYTTMPAFLAFGPLVITDIAVTLFCVLVIWQLPELWRSLSRGAALKFGLVLAGALLTKFSSGLLFFMFAAVAVSLRVRPVSGQPTEKAELRAWRRRAWRNLLKGALWAALLVYIVYLVLSWNQPTDSFQVIPHGPTSVIVRRLLMPPWLYLRGLLGVVVTAGRPTYILGHAYQHGIWFYFPVLFLLKSTMAFLLLLLLAVVTAVIVKLRPDTHVSVISEGLELHWRAVWVSLAVFAGACMLSPLQISIRHFAVPLVLLVLLLAPLPRMLASLPPRSALAGKGITITLALVSLLTAVQAYPNYFSFLSSLSWGRPGYALVNDSNLDWNHALPDVERFVQRRGVKRVLLDQYAFSDPTVYVPEAQLWSCQEPSAPDSGQWAVVSGNMIQDGGNCLWLLDYPHEKLAGGSMYAFRLPEVIPPAGTPGGPPLPAVYRYFVGGAFDARKIFMACVRDPQQLQPTWDRMIAMMKAYQEQKKK